MPHTPAVPPKVRQMKSDALTLERGPYLLWNATSSRTTPSPTLRDIRPQSKFTGKDSHRSVVRVETCSTLRGTDLSPALEGLASDHQLLDLAGAFVDPEDADVAI